MLFSRLATLSSIFSKQNYIYVFPLTELCSRKYGVILILQFLQFTIQHNSDDQIDTILKQCLQGVRWENDYWPSFNL